MTKEEINLAIAKKRNGAYRKVTYVTELSSLKDYKDLKITKKVETHCRTGCTYSNLSRVIQKRLDAAMSSGQVITMTAKPSVQPNGLPFGEWVSKYLIQKGDQLYVRIIQTFAPNHKSTTTYYKNGVEISELEARQYTGKTNWRENTNYVKDVKIENIISLD